MNLQQLYALLVSALLFACTLSWW